VISSPLADQGEEQGAIKVMKAKFDRAECGQRWNTVEAFATSLRAKERGSQ